MFRLSYKKRILRVLVITLFVVTSLVTSGLLIHNNSQKDSYATTDDGGTISILPGQSIHYDHWSTNNFKVQSGGTQFQAYCAQPSLSTPSGSQTAHKINSDDDVMKYSAIKLIMYIHQYAGTNSTVNAAKRAIFDSWPEVSDSGDRYVWTHAIIGALYANDYHGVDATNVAYIDRAIGILRSYINNDSNVWALAKNFQLYRTQSSGFQDVVWMEDATTYGTIRVKKCDSETRNCTPQGNASLSGIKFQLINSSGENIYNPKTGDFYSDGEVIETKTTNASGEVAFSNLLADDIKYTVKETETNTTYRLTASPQTVTLTKSGQSSTLSFYDTVRKGKYVVNKVDKETGTCTNTGELSFAGTTFQLINNSTNAVYYDGSSRAVGAVVATRTMAAGDCSVTFDNLPYGSYQLKETVSAEGYVKDSTIRNVTIPTSGQETVTYTFENQPIRGDLKFVKMDKTNERPMENTIFSITGIDKNYQMGETHIVVTNPEGIVNTASSFALHSNNTNGYDPQYNDTDENIVFLGYGTWFGRDKNGNALPVRDNLGALPYGTYIVQELKCDHNYHCLNVLTERTTVHITEHGQVLDLGNWDDACNELKLNTTATDKKDGDKYVEIGKKVTITDKVEYCVKKNTAYTLRGYLVDKATGEKLLINGKPVTATKTIKSEEECGTVNLDFKFDATGLGGKELVVFEQLYYKTEKIYEHEDLEDEGQTVEIVSLHTLAYDKKTRKKQVPMAKKVEITDTVTYCLKPGVEYTIKGVMMNKKTKKPLVINGKKVEAEVKFTPEQTCGEFDMFYTLDTRKLGGADLVIFESLYRDGQLIIEHKDFNNSDESISVEEPAPEVPETGYVTSASTEGQTGQKTVFVVGVIVIPLGGYVVARMVAKKRFFKR